MKPRIMNDTLGNIIVVGMIFLTFLLPVLYVLSPDPTESPLITTAIRGSLAALIILVVTLTGMLTRELSSST